MATPNAGEFKQYPSNWADGLSSDFLRFNTSDAGFASAPPPDLNWNNDLGTALLGVGQALVNQTMGGGTGGAASAASVGAPMFKSGGDNATATTSTNPSNVVSSLAQLATAGLQFHTQREAALLHQQQTQQQQQPQPQMPQQTVQPPASTQVFDASIPPWARVAGAALGLEPTTMPAAASVSQSMPQPTKSGGDTQVQTTGTTVITQTMMEETMQRAIERNNAAVQDMMTKSVANRSSSTIEKLVLILLLMGFIGGLMYLYQRINDLSYRVDRCLTQDNTSALLQTTYRRAQQRSAQQQQQQQHHHHQQQNADVSPEQMARNNAHDVLYDADDSNAGQTTHSLSTGGAARAAAAAADGRQ